MAGVMSLPVFIKHQVSAGAQLLGCQEASGLAQCPSGVEFPRNLVPSSKDSWGGVESFSRPFPFEE